VRFTEIEVFDSGVGIPQLFGLGTVLVSKVDFRGIGLMNVTTRLEKLYDRSDLLTIESTPGEGTRVKMRIPVEPNAVASKGVNEIAIS